MSHLPASFVMCVTRFELVTSSVPAETCKCDTLVHPLLQWGYRYNVYTIRPTIHPASLANNEGGGRKRAKLLKKIYFRQYH